MKKVSLDYLNLCLDYNPETGILTWKHRPENHFKTKRGFSVWNARYSNKAAGTLNPSDGYIEITIDYIRYPAHRLGYALFYDYFPENEIDHKDRVRHHNWISNLREVSHQCNMRNAGMLKNNTSGVKGVHFDKLHKKYRSYITIDGKRINLGRSDDFDSVVLSRWKAEKFYKFPNCNTSSSAYNYLKQNNLIPTEAA